MKIEQSLANGVFTATMSDKLSFADHGVFRDLIKQVDERHPASVVFDLQRLVSIDSAGLGMLMIARDASAKGGWSLTLRHPQGQVATILKVACFDKLLTIEA